jgi:hypothetical protein
MTLISIGLVEIMLCASGLLVSDHGEAKFFVGNGTVDIALTAMSCGPSAASANRQKRALPLDDVKVYYPQPIPAVRAHHRFEI